MAGAPRRAAPADAPLLEALLAGTDLGPWTPEQWAGEFAHPGSRIWWVPDEGAALAVLVTRCATDEAEILSLAVAPVCRRRGLARQLLQGFWREEPEVGRLFLEVRASNQGAQAFYRTVGFTEIGRRASYYPDGDDAIAMAARRPGSPE